MLYRETASLCLSLALVWTAPDLLGQSTVELQPATAGDAFRLSAVNLPKRGVSVVWKATGGLAKGGDWSAVHAFPVQKQTEATLPIQPGITGSAFYRLSWQDIAVPANMIWIPQGEFKMGSPEDEPGRYPDEGPVHEVTIPHGFWMDQYEVTQEQFEKLMQSNPSSTFHTANLPVNRITWQEANDYCDQLTETERHSGTLPLGFVYRLPTEAEWEYACRAGTETAYSYGDYTEGLSQHGWWAGNSDGLPDPVGKLTPNPWGLYDIHGNLFEWCLDKYKPYPGGRELISNTIIKVLRGGAYYCPDFILRSACRAEPQAPDYRWVLASFRVVLAPPLGEAPE